MAEDPHAAMRDYVRTVSSLAWQQLRASETLEPAMISPQGLRWGRRQLHCWWTAEGFYEYEPYTMTVFQPFEPGPPRLRRAEWRSSEAMDALHEWSEKKRDAPLEPRPVFHVQDVLLDADTYERLLGEASTLRLPVVWPWQPERDSLTTDTGMVGFEFFDQCEPQASICCQWSARIPSGWDPVLQWFDNMVLWLQSCLDEAKST